MFKFVNFKHEVICSKENHLSVYENIVYKLLKFSITRVVCTMYRSKNCESLMTLPITLQLMLIY